MLAECLLVEFGHDAGSEWEPAGQQERVAQESSGTGGEALQQLWKISVRLLGILGQLLCEAPDGGGCAPLVSEFFERTP